MADEILKEINITFGVTGLNFEAKGISNPLEALLLIQLCSQAIGEKIARDAMVAGQFKFPGKR